ncbi:MAG: sensor domain-containing diguanylate cyclase [Nitrospiraceae bacterium]|nr:sensor domain-containing diguanylate cyclase [Nitrospiraceae bacterium]
MGIIIFFVFAAATAVFVSVSYAIGGKKSINGNGQLSGEEDREALALDARREAERQEMLSEIRILNEKLERYLHFVVSIPVAVKNINSTLSVDELINSSIRLTRAMIEAEEIGFYLFEKKTKTLKLMGSLGEESGKRAVIDLGKGIGGRAGELGMAAEMEQFVERQTANEAMTMAAPAIFRGNLIGVITAGGIKNPADNDKRFLSMIADLLAVAYVNILSWEETKIEANRDALTGIYNRRYFFRVAMEAVRKSLDYDLPLSIFLFDVDDFKHYNDKNGHPAGDRLLKDLCKLVKDRTRSINTFARYGGEEFIVLLKDSDRDAAMSYAEEIRRAIEAHTFEGEGGRITISGGVATFPMNGQNLDEIIEHADCALFTSKKAGKNRIAVFDPARSRPKTSPISRRLTPVSADCRE